MKAWLVICIIAIIFVISYDPSSGTLEKYLLSGPKNYPAETNKGCANNEFRANNPDPCENSAYQSVQFGTQPKDTPPRIPESYLGAIVGQQGPAPSWA